ncbi:uncharacterized protein mbd6 [Alosa pseudoharengus]|uniref:uncharacterized protein mbd6 n=1 Tax=Alosa pseudoharengus TaxID=34774 RepID=UPI003F898082
MTGGSECAAGDKDGVPARTAQVPVGWQRKLEDGAVAYISPSGTILSSVEEVRTYLLTDSTCKCGLECPLVIHKVFSFDPVAVVRPQSQQPGKAEEDMTKLCNHRRKVVAMAALCRSMQASQLPLHGSGSSFCSMERGGPLGVRMEDGGHCTYSVQPRLSAQSRSNSSPAPCGASSSFPISPTMTLHHNGSLAHSNALLSSEGAVVSKRPSSSSPGCNSAGYGVPPWYARPSAPQTIIQRLPQASGSPGSSKLGTHPGSVLSLDVALSASSSPSALSLTMTGGRPGQSHQQQQQQGSGVKSPSPISLCLSPSRPLDATSPRQRSRHSSASSTLSEQGGGVAGPLGGAKPPCPARSPLPPNAAPCLSPKVPLRPASPRGRLEGMLQHYKDCSAAGPAPPQHPSNQSNFQVPQNLSHFVAGGDRKNGPAAAPGPGSSVHGSAGAAGGFLGLQKTPQHVSSFPASSLLSAAAKAQMASQKSQAVGGAVDGGVASSVGPEKDPQQSKVLISTLNSSLPPSSARPLPMTAFLLPHSPSLPSQTLPLALTTADKVSRRKRQRRSPTVLSMLKESQLHSLRAVGDLCALPAPSSMPSPSSSPSSSSPSPSPSTPLLPPPSSEHFPAQQQRPSAPHNCSLPPGLPKQVDAEDLRRLGPPVQPLATPSPSQPLSALLQLLSMQNAQASAIATQSSSSSSCSSSSSPLGPAPPLAAPANNNNGRLAHAPSPVAGLVVQPPDHCDDPHMQTAQQQQLAQSLVPALESPPQLPSSHSFPLMAMAEEMDAAINTTSTTTITTTTTTAMLKSSPSHILNLSQHRATTAPSGPPQDASGQILGLLGQLSAAPPCGPKLGVGPHDEVSYSAQSQAMDAEGSLVSVETADGTEARLLGLCASDPGLALPSADPCSALQLAESFPFMNQEQLLQLLSANSGLPSLLPPFLSSLPLWTGLQQTTQTTAQPQQPPQNHHHHHHHQQQQQQLQQAGLLNQTSQLNILPSLSGAQGDFPVNLISLLNPPPPPAAAAGVAVQGSPCDAGDKPSLQALLMASLLLSQQHAATMLPLAGLGQLNLDMQSQQQHQHQHQPGGAAFAPLPDGLSLDKTPGLLDSVLTGPGLLEALQGLVTAGDVGALSAPQSLLLSAPLPPPAFLSLNPALLAAALGPADPLPTQHSPPAHSQGTVSSPSAGSTSVPCAPLLPSAVSEEINSLVPLVTEQDKSNGQNAPLLPPLLPPGMMGDLTALGNISGLHSLLGAGPLLLPQVPGPALSVPLPQGQGALNPLACLINSLQLNMGPTLTVDKQLGLAEATNAPQEEDIPVSQLAQEPVPNPGHVQSAQPPQRESAAAGALFDPYGSFMDTIYTSFLQVSGKDPDALGGGGGGSGGAASSSSSSNPLSFPAPDLPALLVQPSAPPPLSPRRACSVHNSDLSRLGMEAAQSPARGTPKLSEDASSTPPPSKPAGGGSEGHDDQAPPQMLPLPPAFLEEAKTDGSSSLCVYSNGLTAGTGLQDEREEGDGGRTQPQGYLSPRANAEPAQESAVSNEADSGKEPATRTGGRRGRKRKQVLERVADGPGGLDSIIEEPQVTTALPKPARSTRGKRRRVVR